MSIQSIIRWLDTYQEPQLADYVSLTDRRQETKNES